MDKDKVFNMMDEDDNEKDYDEQNIMAEDENEKDKDEQNMMDEDEDDNEKDQDEQNMCKRESTRTTVFTMSPDFHLIHLN